MKIEKLNDDKIKIILTTEDLAERNIDLYGFMYNSPESQDLFWDMIDRAENECGFCVGESNIYVEASTYDNNFVLTVTKSEKNTNNKSKVKNDKKSPFKLKRKMINSKSDIYAFESFDDVCSFATSVPSLSAPINTLYKLNDTYYLESKNVSPTILDYANAIKSPDIFSLKLNEYGTVVIKNKAVQELNKYFSKKKTKKNE